VIEQIDPTGTYLRGVSHGVKAGILIGRAQQHAVLFKVMVRLAEAVVKGLPDLLKVVLTTMEEATPRPEVGG